MKDGQLFEKDGRWELRFERPLAHPVDRVWSAITEPDGLSAWFPFDIEGERTTGAPLRFVFREEEGHDFSGEMVEFDPPSVMELRWEGDETLRLEVTPTGSGCVLTVINRFDEIGKAARDAAGWHACLDAPRGPPRRRRADRLHRALEVRPPGLRRALRPRSGHDRPANVKGSDPLRFPRRTVVAARRKGQTLEVRAARHT